MPSTVIPHRRGSVRGREHERTGRNNQDAFGWVATDDVMIALVCDGCGSGQHSEAGARLGCQLMLAALRADVALLHHGPCEVVLRRVQRRVLEQLHTLAHALGDPFLTTIREYFLFTIVGVVMTAERTVIFSLGDGVWGLNGSYSSLTYRGNAPPYLAYGLIPHALEPVVRDHRTLQIHWDGATHDTHNVLIGTDGVQDLYDAAYRRVPGKDEPVGPLAQFWCDDRYFTNPYGITRRLALLNRTVTQADWEQRQMRQDSGLLADDTTLIVIRRAATEGGTR